MSIGAIPVIRGCGTRKKGGDTNRRKVFIYVLKDPRSQQVRYVGKSVQPNKRFYMHLWYAKNGEDTYRSRWIQQLLDENLSPVMEILEECEETTWAEREVYWITQFDQLTNTAVGGSGIIAPRTEIWCTRIGLAHKGKEISDKTRAKLSLVIRTKNDAGCKRGHKWTPENTRTVLKNDGSTHRVCKSCAREAQKQHRRKRGVPTVEEFRANYEYATYCLRGHPLSGDNLRLLERKTRIERICRECVRIRNTNSKRRARAKKKEGKQ